MDWFENRDQKDKKKVSTIFYPLKCELNDEKTTNMSQIQYINIDVVIHKKLKKCCINFL